MRQSRDRRTDDMFPNVPQPEPINQGAFDLNVEISCAISRAIKACPHDRYEIAARMSRLLGRDVTKNMIDAYSAGSRDTHIPNFAWCIAFDTATGDHVLLSLFAKKLGCEVLVGREILEAELGRLDMHERELRERKSAIREHLRRRPA